MTLQFRHSMHTGRYRIARQPGRIDLNRQATWATILGVFPDGNSIVHFWALAEALSCDTSTSCPTEHPHDVIQYCIRRGWLQRV